VELRDLETYDVVVLGGGPAGLSAALVLGRSVRSTLVCDTGRYRNERSDALHCFIGHDGVSPLDLLGRTRAQMARYSAITRVEARAETLDRPGDDFAVCFADRAPARARAVLVATGVVDEIPPVPGIEEFWGRSVHVCPYCDGWEHRDAPVAVYGRGSKGAGLALLLRQWTSDLVLCTDGPADLEPDGLEALARRGISVRESRLSGLQGDGGRLRTIHFSDGTSLERTALFFSTGQHPRSPLLERAGCAFRENGGVVCDPEGRTSIPGIYVAGDVSRDVQLAIVAAAEGARAALAINKDLLHRDGFLR